MTAAASAACQIDAYENLRGDVLRSHARPEGLAAVVYHGLLGGLNVVCRQAAAVASPSCVLGVQASAAPAPVTADPALVRLLANMVLLYQQGQQEVSHVV